MLPAPPPADALRRSDGESGVLFELILTKFGYRYPSERGIEGDYRGQNASVIKHNQSALSTIKVRLAISQLPREPTFRSLGYGLI